MEKTRDEYQPTTRKSGSALALVSLVIQLDRAMCERARPTSHEVSSMPSILFRVFSAERPREKKAITRHTFQPSTLEGMLGEAKRSTRKGTCLRRSMMNSCTRTTYKRQNIFFLRRQDSVKGGVGRNQPHEGRENARVRSYTLLSWCPSPVRRSVYGACSCSAYRRKTRGTHTSSTVMSQ